MRASDSKDILPVSRLCFDVLVDETSKSFIYMNSINGGGVGWSGGGELVLKKKMTKTSNSIRFLGHKYTGRVSYVNQVF